MTNGFESRVEHLDCQLRIKERLEHPPTPDLSDDDEGRRRARIGGGGGDKVSNCVAEHFFGVDKSCLRPNFFSQPSARGE